MGRAKKPQPKNLAKKLTDIRRFLNLNQEEMVKYLIPNLADVTASRASVSDYEHGHRTPSILELLQYVRAVRLLTRYSNFSLEDLADDNRKLPWESKV